MKKSSLMGASVVTAALLAVAPIAAPAANAISGTQIVKADDADNAGSSDNSDASAPADNAGSSDASSDNSAAATPAATTTTPAQQQAAITKAFNGFTSTAKVKAADVSSWNAGDLDSNATTLGNFITDTHANSTFAKLFQDSQVSQSSVVTALNDAVNSGDYKVNVALSDGTNDLVTSADVSNALALIKANGGTLKETVTVSYTDPDTNKVSTVATLPMTLTVDAPAADNSTPAQVNNRIYVNAPTAFAPKAGDAVYAYTLSSSFGGTVVNQDGQTVATTPSMGNIQEVDVDGNPVGQPLTATDKFEAGKTYQQTVTFDKTSVGNDAATWNINQKASEGAAYTRTFTVPESGDNGAAVAPDHSTEAVDGVVVVNNDVAHGNAQLYDEAGDAIDGWVLPAGTPWYTAKKVTFLENGQAYYQVSTHAYVKANDVKYITQADWSAQTAKAQITDVNGVFTVKVDGSDILPLKTVALNDAQNAFVSADRILNGGTSWAVDKKAVLNGETYYRVSTNLWVRASSNGLSNGNFVER